MKRIAVIGGGIFGVSAALALCRYSEVHLFERSDALLSVASTNNHLRHHYGYHYPRSRETALESIRGRKRFEEEYGECVIEGFPAYYAIANRGSKTSPSNFIQFCDDLGLDYEIADIPSFLNKSKIALCLKTPEPAYDPALLKEIVEKKLANSTVQVHMRNEIVGGKILEDGRKSIILRNNNAEREEKFDLVICAVYTNFNKVNEWFGFPRKRVQYALMELIDIKLPVDERMGCMVVDGDFSTFVPLREPGVVRLGHVRESVLKKVVSEQLDAGLIVSKNIESNRENIMKASLEFYPFLKDAKFIRSVFITRIVKANVEDTDERPSEITDHGQGIFSIFGGKVISCVDTAEKLAQILNQQRLNREA